jgi:hypothetical protein
LAAFLAAFGLICVPGGGGCTGAQQKPDPGPLPAVELENAYPKLTFDLPLFLCHDGADESLVYVVEQDGRIWRFKNDAATTEKHLFFNIVERMPTRRKRDNEEGLLALAFHPKFKENGYFFVNYSMHAAGGKQRRGVTSRFKWDKAKDGVDMASEKIILEVDEPYGNHNGCMLVFGPDNFLYLTFGDGGSGGDPHGNGQNLGTLLATCLRIDIDKEENGNAYAIPRDNPFVDKNGARPEIWAYGLRNLWRMSFDRDTGTLWGGDVGQNEYEEIDIIVKGGNYGWNKREGTHAFRRGEKTDDMIDPVVDYGRDMGLSITGGYVYRGKLQEALKGIYVYADYGTGRIWGLDYDYKEKKLKSVELLGHFPRATISSFGEDAAGELYACGHRVGTIYRVKAIKE